MYQKILVPVDKSRASMAALKEACELCQQLNSKIHILHVSDMIDHPLNKESHEQENPLTIAKKTIDAYGIPYTTEVQKNTGEKVANIILRSVKENQADLVIMGTHGFSGMMHLLMGSVAEGVLRQAEVPVMLLRRGRPQES